MATYQVLIVEDNADERSRLRGCVEKYASEHNDEFAITEYESAIPLIEASRTFDLIFLDINLPCGINGMEAARILRTYDETTQVVFVTDLAQYAVRGYEVDALGFIVKPISYYGISRYLDKALRVIRRNTGKNITVPLKRGLRMFPSTELVFAETAGHNLVYHLASGQPITARGSLSKLVEELEGEPFVRIASSFLVNMDHVRAIEEGSVIMSTGETLYFTRARKKEALATITSYLGGSI